MKGKKFIRLKAAFLLIAFSLNMVIGFACAIGIDMGFNTHHHDGDETTMLNISHHHDTSHHNDEADNEHHKSKDGKDDCCNDQVMKFSRLDKSVPGSLNSISPIFLISFVSTYHGVDIFNH